jgi:hypothetical protein
MLILETSDTAKNDRARFPGLTPWKVAIGLAISLLLHIILVLWSWNMKFGVIQSPQMQNRPLEVRLIRELPPQPPVPAQVPVPVSAPVPIASKVIARTTQKPRSPPTLQPALPVADTPPITPTLVPSQPQAATGKHLDLDALRANLGAVVAEVDREKRDTPVGQLQAKPLYPSDDESKIGKAISNTTRPDCRNNIANTGLLAPLFLLAMAADKKDSGCKW